MGAASCTGREACKPSKLGVTVMHCFLSWLTRLDREREVRLLGESARLPDNKLVKTVNKTFSSDKWNFINVVYSLIYNAIHVVISDPSKCP